MVTRVQQDFKVCLAPQEVLVQREQLVSRVHPDFLESTVTQAVKVYKAPKDQLVFLVDLEHKALLELLVCRSYINISYDVFFSVTMLIFAITRAVFIENLLIFTQLLLVLYFLCLQCFMNLS